MLGMHSAAETHPCCRIKDFQSVSKRLVFPSLPPTQEHFLRGENYLVLVDQTPEHMGGGAEREILPHFLFSFAAQGLELRALPLLQLGKLHQKAPPSAPGSFQNWITSFSALGNAPQTPM